MGLGARAVDGGGSRSRVLGGPRVLVTGHTGFKGSLARRLAARDRRRGDRPRPRRADRALTLRPRTASATTCARVERDVRDADRAARRGRGRAAGRRLPPRRPAPRAPLLRAIRVETYATNVMGTVTCSTRSAPTRGVRAAVVVTSRQVLRESRVGAGPTARTSRWAATIPTRARRAPPSCRRARTVARSSPPDATRVATAARGQRDRRRRLGRRPAHAGHHAGAPRGRRRSRAESGPRARGSTCSIRSAATCSWLSACGTDPRAAAALELRPGTGGTRGRLAGSSTGWRAAGLASWRGSVTRARTRTRRATQGRLVAGARARRLVPALGSRARAGLDRRAVCRNAATARTCPRLMPADADLQLRAAAESRPR